MKASLLPLVLQLLLFLANFFYAVPIHLSLSLSLSALGYPDLFLSYSLLLHSIPLRSALLGRLALTWLIYEPRRDTGSQPLLANTIAISFDFLYGLLLLPPSIASKRLPGANLCSSSNTCATEKAIHYRVWFLQS